MANSIKRIENIQPDSEIRKSKALIFAQTSPGNLPVPAQRLFLALLASIDKDETSNTFILKGKNIAALADLPANVVGQQLQEMSVSADTLRKYTLVINEDDGNALRVGLISSTKYLKGERAIRVSVDPYLMPYLREMREQFVISYEAGGPMKFRSEYSICLFDMMNYYLSEGYHYFTIEEVRKMFNIPDGKIPATSTLNQKVIKPAIKEINQYTNLEIEIKYEKQSRTIIGYHFYVKEKIKNKTAALSALSKERLEDEFIYKLITDYKFNKYTLSKLIDKYGIQSIKNNFEYTKDKNPNNFARYLYWAINNQIYEKERELEQLKAVDPIYKPELTIPQFRDENVLFEEPIENNTLDYDYEELKERNPGLYEIMNRINKIREERKTEN